MENYITYRYTNKSDAPIYTKGKTFEGEHLSITPDNIQKVKQNVYATRKFSETERCYFIFNNEKFEDFFDFEKRIDTHLRLASWASNN